MPSNQNSIKEYIGARYVPIFYDDGTGSAEWSKAVDYEPLTIVLHEGNSYTSRQYVPVGVAITNTAYWLQTGNWNSQIESYRQEVRQYDGRITDAQGAADNAQANADANFQRILDETVNRNNADINLQNQINQIDTTLAGVGRISNVVAIGDSWGDGWNGSATIKSWIEHMATMAGIRTLRQAHEGGAGFYAGGQVSGKNYTALLQTVVDDTSPDQRKAVQVVIAAGGINDRNAARTQILASIRSFCTLAKSAFPNAKILIGCVSAINTLSDPWGSLRALRAYASCGSYGASYITNSEYLPFTATYASDGAHLLDYEPIGEGLAAALYSGSVDVQWQDEIRLHTTGGEDIDWHPTANIFISNDTATVALQNHRWTGLDSTLDCFNYVTIGKWECSMPVVRGYGFECTCAAIAHVYGGAWVGGTAVLQLASSGNVNVRFVNANGITLAHVNEFAILGGWATQSSILA